MTDKLPPPIGLSGFAGSGKTAAALYIEKHYGYRRHHIAEPLRAMLRTLLLQTGMDDATVSRYLTGDLKEEVIPFFGATSRSMQITLGTEWMRECVDADGWVKVWGHQADVLASWENVASTNDSVRFPNEEDVIRERDGFTILLMRPGKGPAAFKWKRVGPLLYRWFGKLWGVHDSERVDRLHPTVRLLNDEDLPTLYQAIDRVMLFRGVPKRG